MNKSFIVLIVIVIILTSCTKSADIDDISELNESSVSVIEKSSVNDTVQKKSDNDSKQKEKSQSMTKKSSDVKSKEKLIMNDMNIGDKIDSFTLVSFDEDEEGKLYFKLSGAGSAKGKLYFENIFGRYNIKSEQPFLNTEVFVIYDGEERIVRGAFADIFLNDDDTKKYLTKEQLKKVKDGAKLDVQFSYSDFSCHISQDKSECEVNVTGVKVSEQNFSNEFKIKDKSGVIDFIVSNSESNWGSADNLSEYVEFVYEDFNKDGTLDVACYSSSEVKFITYKNNDYEFIDIDANFPKRMKFSIDKSGDFILCKLSDDLGNDTLYIMTYNDKESKITLCCPVIYYKKRETVKSADYLNKPHTLLIVSEIEQKSDTEWQKFLIIQTDKVEEGGMELREKAMQYTYNKDRYEYDIDVLEDRDLLDVAYIINYMSIGDKVGTMDIKDKVVNDDGDISSYTLKGAIKVNGKFKLKEGEEATLELDNILNKPIKIVNSDNTHQNYGVQNPLFYYRVGDVLKEPMKSKLLKDGELDVVVNLKEITTIIDRYDVKSFILIDKLSTR